MWRREDGSLVESPIETSDERGILRLSAIRSSVAGTYTCEVRAESGELARRTVRVEVHSKLKFYIFFVIFPSPFLFLIMRYSFQNLQR